MGFTNFQRADDGIRTHPCRMAFCRAAANTTSAWWRLSGSNRQHSACRADTLPIELSPHSSHVLWLFLFLTHDTKRTKLRNFLKSYPLCCHFYGAHLTSLY